MEHWQPMEVAIAAERDNRLEVLHPFRLLKPATRTKIPEKTMALSRVSSGTGGGGLTPLLFRGA